MYLFIFEILIIIVLLLHKQDANPRLWCDSAGLCLVYRRSVCADTECGHAESDEKLLYFMFFVCFTSFCEVALFFFEIP